MMRRYDELPDISRQRGEYGEQCKAVRHVRDERLSAAGRHGEKREAIIAEWKTGLSDAWAAYMRSVSEQPQRIEIRV